MTKTSSTMPAIFVDEILPDWQPGYKGRSHQTQTLEPVGFCAQQLRHYQFTLRVKLPLASV